MRGDARLVLSLIGALVAFGCTGLNSGDSIDGGAGAGDAGGGGTAGSGGTSGSGGTGGGGGFGGGGGSGASVNDPCDTAGCDEHATCTVVSGEALCECDSPYVGTGESCMLPDPPDECADVDCPTGEVCIEGAVCVPICTLDDSCELGQDCLEAADCESNVCIGDECRPSCEGECGNAEPCVEDADCTSGYCARDESDQLTGICRPACARAGCETADPCTRAADCSGGVCTGGLCQPACGTACQPGDDCATSNNCAGADICDEIGHVCLTSCSDAAGDFTLTTSADFTNARHCWEIDDNLIVSANFATVTDDHLPYLVEVSGDLTLQYGGSLIEITLPRLERIGMGFSTGNNLVERIFLPELQQIGEFSTTDGFNVGLSLATAIYAPKLERVYGPLLIQGAPNLTSVRFDSLAYVSGSLTIASANMISTLDIGVLDMRFDVGGSITLNDLPKIPWSTFTPFILPLNGDEDVTSVGCETTSPCNCGNTSCVPAP
jgi:hypothetical protein